MWPFILNTVSPCPSVRKWLLILALNLTACQCEVGAAEVWDEGSWVSTFPSNVFHSFKVPSPHLPPQHSFSPGGVCFLRLQIKVIGLLTAASVWWVQIRPFFSKADPSLLPYAGTQWLEEERLVEWQPYGINNKTVIERYVIMPFSSCGKWYQEDIPVKKREREREKKRDLF